MDGGRSLLGKDNVWKFSIETILERFLLKILL